ncbi:MAG: hypothetical protein FWD61_07740 [Phycisphaerales bacterium]|nr:hypothetical protein [Phycisphaerales bacterium]
MNCSLKVVSLLLLVVSLLLLAAVACGQTLPAKPATQPATRSADVATPASPEARQILQRLHDRKATLKDFTAKVDYSVEHPAGDTDGNVGSVVYSDEALPPSAPKLAAIFTGDTEDGKPVRIHARTIALDGKALTIIDFNAKDFKQQKAPPDKPFNPNSLDSPIPVPLGLDVEEVVKNFVVTVQPPASAADPNLESIRVVPRIKGKFDYKQLDITIDKKLMLPVKVVVRAVGGDVTTIKFSEPRVNTGKVEFPDTTPPKEAGWTIEIK